MRKEERLRENFGSGDVKLTREEFEQIETALENIHIYGNRTDEDIARLKDMRLIENLNAT